MPVKVKICGIRTLEEAVVASMCAADFLGFNFWPRSPRYVNPEVAAEIVRQLPTSLLKVGVFVNEEVGRVREIAERLKLDAVQLHGDESPDYCGALEPISVIKAFRVGEGFDPASIASYPLSLALLDSSVAGSYGGTGQTFDWSAAIEAKAYAEVMLAGGLNALTVRDAIIKVRPAAIDVCSGVESAPGLKDLDKIRSFLGVVARTNQILTDQGKGK
ncbi:MAG TPA: phosphoribosylanthranilate isomerase [Blastocatellia bacterium]|nr:phosphoribosylanthranilate isomerase [Blastocatellia bacterium]